ncbi:radical SAM protein [Candidatus Woesearchaeota archaeon]|nr:radical SAM protein [Candidatus Woesearchaeota archaeon]
MATLKFRDLRFSDEESRIRVSFMDIYCFYLEKSELCKLGKYAITKKSIEFSSGKKNENLQQKFTYLLSKGFESLRSSLNGKPALYIHRNSGIPLIGSNEFGIIDRGTNTIEIKPLTTCNIDCIFCSVDHSKRISDIVVEPEYLVEELKKVIDIKKNRVNIHIGSQGDPGLYSNLEFLVKELRKIKKVSAISMVTNGTLITKNRAEKLIKSGLTHFHISLHTTSQEMADRLSQSKYPLKRIMEICKFVSEKAHLLLVPVWVPGINDKDIEDVIIYAKEIGAKIGVQNFLEYKFEKKPVNPIPMKLFFKKINELEEKLDIDLTTLDGELKILPDEALPKPFRKGETIQVEIKAKSRMKNSMIAAARERAVTVINCRRETGSIKVKLIRDKDNIFIGVPTA